MNYYIFHLIRVKLFKASTGQKALTVGNSNGYFLTDKTDQPKQIIFHLILNKSQMWNTTGNKIHENFHLVQLFGAII